VSHIAHPPHFNIADRSQRLRDPRVDGHVKSLPRSGKTGPIELPITFTAAPR
jgi:hypothetical protein